MTDPAYSLSTRIRRIPRQYLLCFFSTLIWGLLAHGMTLFNKYSLYEDVSQLFGVGATYQSGRWMLDILHRLEVFLLGGSYSLPLLNGLVTILYIGLTGCLICKLLSIEKTGSCIALGGILVTTPVLTGTFGYMFTAPHYALGLLMGVAGVVVVCKKSGWVHLLCGTFLISCAMGVYQAVLPVVLGLLLIRFIHITFAQKDWSVRVYCQKAGYMLLACALFMGLYFLINKLYLHYKSATLLSYQGIDTAGKLPVSTYLKRALYAYKEFLLPSKDSSAYMYPNGMIWLYRLAQLAAGLLTIRMLVCYGKRFMALLLPICLLPLAMNFIYVMCDKADIHSLMVYNHVLLFIYLLWISGTALRDDSKLPKKLLAAMLAIPLLLSGLYVRYDNVCYLKAEFVQEQTIRYFTTLVTRIQSTPGYRDDMAVNFLNFNEKADSTLTQNEGFDSIAIIPYYDTGDMVNSFASRSFIRYWCGFDPVYDYAGYTEDPQVQAMPCYPDDGSIAVINDTIVVKFAP